jgi:general secretion pathway protein F
MSVKHYKIIYQQDNKKQIKIISATSIDDLYNNYDLPKNIININIVKKYNFKYKKTISKLDIYNLFTEINIMLQSDLSLYQSIEVLLSKYTKDDPLYKILNSMMFSMKQGTYIYKSLEKYHNQLGSIVVSFIKVGELNGNLKDSIYALCIVLEKDNNFKQLIKSKLTYPIFLFASLFISIIIIFIFVIPKFEYMFSQLGASLPYPTQILLWTKSFVFEYYSIIISIISSILIIFLILINKSSKFKYNIDKMLIIKVPLLSKLLLTYQQYRFFLILKVLLESKYKISQALASSKLIINNRYFLEKITDIEKYLIQGKELSDAFDLVDIFDDFIIRLLLVAQKSNNVSEIICNIYDVYEKRLQLSINKFSLTIEPILVAIIGIIILFIMLAIFLPIWQMGTVLS